MKDAPSLRKEVADTLAPDPRRDRFRGALLGLAVGNTLGLPVESWPSEEIQQRYPNGIREIDPMLKAMQAGLWCLEPSLRRERDPSSLAPKYSRGRPADVAR